MTRTPDEIKKGLECCLGDTHAYHCDECPYADDESEVDDGCGDNGIQLLEDALALIQQLEDDIDMMADKLTEMHEALPRWIPVEERLPDGEAIAANFAPGTYGYKEYLLGYVHKDGDMYFAENSCEILHTVTHWMPLSEPPKEE